jgi:cytochrome c-type biogenesis protein CcsB
MDLPLFAVGLAFYLIASVGFVVHLLAMKDAPRRIALAALTIAFGLDTLAILLHPGAVAGLAPSSFHDQLALLAWLTVGLYLLLQLRFQLTVVGALVSPLAFLLMLSAYFVYSGVRTLPPQLQDAWLPAHVAPAFLGYAIFALAFCVSLVYLLQERQLKSKRRGGILRRLPPLESLDDLNYRFVAWGFALFTVGIVTGALLAKAKWGAFWSWEPVQVLSVVTWLLYAVLLHTRSAGWRGHRAATLTIVGFALLIASFLSLNLGFPGRHGGTLG